MIAASAEDGFGGAQRKKSVYSIGIINPRDFYPQNVILFGIDNQSEYLLSI